MMGVATARRRLQSSIRLYKISVRPFVVRALDRMYPNFFRPTFFEEAFAASRNSLYRLLYAWMFSGVGPACSKSVSKAVVRVGIACDAIRGERRPGRLVSCHFVPEGSRESVGRPVDLLLLETGVTRRNQHMRDCGPKMRLGVSPGIQCEGWRG